MCDSVRAWDLMTDEQAMWNHLVQPMRQSPFLEVRSGTTSERALRIDDGPLLPMIDLRHRCFRSDRLHPEPQGMSSAGSARET